MVHLSAPQPRGPFSGERRFVHPQGVLLAPFLPASSAVRTQGPRCFIAQSKGLILKIQKTVEVLQVQFVSGACDAEY